MPTITPLTSKVCARYRRWWQDRVLCGSQLQGTGYEKNWDYFGPDEWRDYVAMPALRRDFELGTGIRMHPCHFTQMFKRVIPGVSYTSRWVRYPLDEGIVQGRQKLFVVFGKPELTKLVV